MPSIGEEMSPARRTSPALSPDQAGRYARHLALPEIGREGQRRLLASRVLIVGVGGLGSPAAFYLAAAGVGFLRLVDDDAVSASNLQRQILHGLADIARPKVASARETLRAINPDPTLDPRRVRFTPETAAELLDHIECVIDATDNAAAKFHVAHACHRHRIPYIHAGIRAFSGQVMTILPERSACPGCLFGGDVDPAAIDAETPRGPLGAVPGIIGSIQAAEALKLLLGIGDLLTDRLLVFDALRMRVRCIPVRRTPECPVCGGPGRKNG
jgi:molybdopterin/thiamine biosynthesis adenylyltransferase